MLDEKDKCEVLFNGNGGPPYAVLESEKGRVIIRSWTAYEYVALLPDHFKEIIKILWETSPRARDSIRMALQECGASIQPRMPKLS